jgi:hypothetical protein
VKTEETFAILSTFSHAHKSPAWHDRFSRCNRFHRYASLRRSMHQSMMRTAVAGLALLWVASNHVLAQDSAASGLWARADFLLWRVKNDETPLPMVTTGPAGDPRAGVLGNPATRVLYGDQLDYRLNGGAYLAVGWWCDPDRLLGVEFGGFCLETHTIHGEFESNRTDGAPVIARPFFNVLTGQPDAQTITSNDDPLGGSYLGGIDIFGDSRTWGAEINALSRAAEGESWHVNLVYGFRNLGQKDQLRFSYSSTVLRTGTVGFDGDPAAAPNIVSYRDYFETTNFYYGGQIGADGRWQRGRFLADARAIIGLGATDQRQEIGAHTLHTDSTGFTKEIAGNLFASPDILGHHQQWHFAWTSELKLRVGVALAERLQLHVGYTFLYWNGVVRPGRQLTPQVDPRQVPSNLAYVGPNPPREAPFRVTDFWAHGLALGLAWNY